MADKQIQRFIKKLEEHSYTKCYVQNILELENNGHITCPLHPDTSESCFVDIGKGYFECTACGIRGGFVLLLTLVEKKSFKNIVLMLARETQIEIPPIILGFKPSGNK